MRIQYVELSDFRNIENCRVKLGSRFNLIVGKNAQGKTNFLESVALLTELRSFRKSSLEQYVSFGKEVARLSALAYASGLDYEIDLQLAKGVRRLKVNGKAVVKQKDYLGSLPVVVFAPEDVRMSQGGPDRRRRFLDRALFLLQPEHWDRALEYKQLLKRRNLLLKELRTKDPLFEIYSEKLSALGAEISFHRHRLALSPRPQLREAVSSISEDSDRVDIAYQSHLDPSDTELVSDGGARMMELLERSLPRERRIGHTTVGPHVEDLAITIDGRPATDFASQGQHRTIALAMKIAEIEVVNRSSGAFPTLLIDDLSSELDHTRREQLFAYLKHTGGQVLLTSTDPDIAAGFADEDLIIYRVRDGRIEHQSGDISGEERPSEEQG